MNWTWAGIITAACILIAAVIGYNRGFIKEAVSTLLLFLSILMVWFINPYVNQFLRENTPLYTTLSEGSAKAVSGVIESGVKVSREEQGKLIDSLPLPKMLKEDMKEKNTAGTYRDLEVKNFSDYIAKYLAELLLNGISFLASFLLATIILRVIAFALDLFANLPVIRGVNKLAGAALGAIEGVALVWLIMAVLTVLCSTAAGKTALEMIRKDTFLDYMYGQNLFLKFFSLFL